MVLCYATGALTVSYSSYLANISTTSTQVNYESNLMARSCKYYLLQHLLFETTAS